LASHGAINRERLRLSFEHLFGEVGRMQFPIADLELLTHRAMLHGDRDAPHHRVDRVAHIPAGQDLHDRRRDELRAEAFGWLARPAGLMALLLEHDAA
jgi:hypothetical protein